MQMLLCMFYFLKIYVQIFQRLFWVAYFVYVY